MDLQASEEQWKGARQTFEGVELVLRDANLRLRAISSLRKATLASLQILNNFSLDGGDNTRLEDGPATGTSHLAITNKLMKQQEKTKKGLEDRIAILETAEKNAKAALDNELESYNVAQVHICGLEEDVRIFRDQVAVFESSIGMKRRRFSAVRKLSTEVWLQVFQFVVFSPPNLSLGVNCKFPVINPAYPLTQVCQSWRMIVSNAASLWSCFYIKRLVLTTSNSKYLQHCLGQADKIIAVLQVQTWVGLASHANVLSNLFQGFKINELQLHVTADSSDAAVSLLDNLPTPFILRVVNEDRIELQEKLLTLTIRPKSPERLQTVEVNNLWVFHGHDEPPYSSMRHIIVHSRRCFPSPIQLRNDFGNVTTMTMTGANKHPVPPSEGDLITFPHLRRITAPITRLVNTFISPCRMPALCEIATWVMDGKRPGIPSWKSFLDRDGLRSRLELIEIHDMDPMDAGFIVKYLRELCSIPRMAFSGRSVDHICQQMVDPNEKGQILELQTLVVQKYLGDGASVLHLVTSYNMGPDPRALRIDEVLWDDCCNVTPQMHRDIDRICRE
jgi:hypothetical protein